MKFISFVFVIILLILGCKGYKSNSFSFESKKSDTLKIDYNSDFENVKKKIIRSGDIEAYTILSRKYSIELNYIDLLYYSQLMCNKYKDSDACFSCYCINSEIYTPENFKTNDSFTKKIGVYYLLKSFELGNASSKFEIKKYFKKNRIPSSREFLCNLE